MSHPSRYDSCRNYWLYIGTYTGQGAKGIYACRFDSAMGIIAPPHVAAETEEPSFLAVHPCGQYLYALNEIKHFEGQPSGAVSAFAIDNRSGELRLLNQVASRGAGPTHICLDRTGKHAFVANYGGGSVAVLGVEEDGQLGTATALVQHRGSSLDPDRQRQPHPHGGALSNDNRFALIADLGLDQVSIYTFDQSTGSLMPNQLQCVKANPGAGPRHIAFHPNGRVVYVNNEMQSTVEVFSYEQRSGVLHSTQILATIPKAFTGHNLSAEILVDPSGEFLYVSNRGHDSIAVFTIAAGGGSLSNVQQISSGGRTPRSLAIDPTGNWMLAANQESSNIVVFRVDRQTGRLSPTHSLVEAPAPACLVFPPGTAPW